MKKDYPQFKFLLNKKFCADLFNDTIICFGTVSLVVLTSHSVCTTSRLLAILSGTAIVHIYIGIFFRPFSVCALAQYAQQVFLHESNLNYALSFGASI